MIKLNQELIHRGNSYVMLSHFHIMMSYVAFSMSSFYIISELDLFQVCLDLNIEK